MDFIWATRGRTWGFRFLRNEGGEDPLPIYDRAFRGLEGYPEAWRRVSGTVALRFPDPLKRKDRAGRTIPHEFVIFPPLADRIDSVDDGIRVVWPLVKEEFARVWERYTPSSTDA